MHASAAIALLAAVSMLPVGNVGAEEIKVLASVGIKAALDELVPRFERATGHDVTAAFDLASVLRASIDGGEPFDVAILTPPLLDELVASGAVAAGSRSPVARVGLGLMVRGGAAKPDVSSVESFERALLDARSVTYATAGASGVAFVATVEALGIADEVLAKARPAASPEEVSANVIGGLADVAVLPVSEILPVAGAELGGVFPADVQTYVVMAAGIAVQSTRPSAARELISFLLSPANDDVIEASGMQRVPRE